MRTLADFTYYEPKSIIEALSILKTYHPIPDNNDGPQIDPQDPPKAKVYAGGVDVLDLLKKRYRLDKKNKRKTPEVLINIKKIEEPNVLNRIYRENGTWHIGPTATLKELAEKIELKNDIPFLSNAAKKIATPQIRNVATIGGNLCQDVRCWFYRSYYWQCSRNNYKGSCSAKNSNEDAHRFHAIKKEGQSPCHAVIPSDLAPCLKVLKAKLKVVRPKISTVDPKHSRVIDLKQEKLYSDKPSELGTVLGKNEIIVDIVVEEIPEETLFIKNSVRNALDFANVNIAMAKYPDETLVAIGGIAPTIIFAKKEDIANELPKKSKLPGTEWKLQITRELLTKLDETS